MLNKFIIPAALLATVVIAGIFALMPVEKASTVHGSLTSTTTGQERLIHVSFNTTLAEAQRADADNVPVIAAESGSTIVVRNFILQATPSEPGPSGGVTNWECGLTDGTNSLLTTNASRLSPINGTSISGLASGEGLYIQVDPRTNAPAAVSGACSLYVVVDSVDG